MTCRRCHTITSNFYLVKTKKGKTCYCRDCYELKMVNDNLEDDFPTLVKKSKHQF